MDNEILAQIEAAVNRRLAEVLPQAMAPNAACYTVDDVAKMAGVSTRTIRRHEEEGKLRVRFPMAKRRFHHDDVDAYLRGKAAKSWM